MTLALAILALLPATAMADWPVYGHDLSNTRDAGSEGPPAAKVPSLAQAWKFTSQTGDFTGTPAVAGGVVVAGDQGGHVYALDAVTGKVLWSQDAGAPVTGSAAIDLDAPGGPAAFVPVAELGRPRLLALGLRDGARRWETVLTTQDNASVFGSPTFWRGTVYMGTSGPNTDDTRARGSLVGLDERTGALRWQTFTVPPDADGAAVWSTPAIDPATGRLYVGTGNNYHDPATETEDAILAFDAATGAMVGRFQATSGDTFAADNPAGPDYDFGASPNLIEGPNGRALVGEGQKSGTYWALDRATMQPVWHTAVGPGGPLGGILGSTAYDGRRVYGTDTLDGGVFALEAGGKSAWASAETGGAHLSAATVAHGVLYTVDPTGQLVARAPASGDVLTRLSLGGPSFGGVSATGGALYVAVGTGPPPAPAPQQDGSGSIIAFGDTSRSGAAPRPAGAAQPAPAQTRRTLRLAVAPRRVRAHRRVVLRFRVLAGTRRVSRATIRIAGRRRTTGPRGTVAIAMRFRRPARHVARATAPGARAAAATIRVVG
jgi:polyvinyl alcohol dehydrogenase (cytochrome)